MFRRIAAALLALCFGVYSAEALIADVHDGDATTSEQVRYAGASDAPAAIDLHTHSDTEAPANDGHPVHVCHGGHAHIGLTSSGFELDTPAPDPVAVIVGTALPPVDARREPQLRPPIA